MELSYIAFGVTTVSLIIGWGLGFRWKAQLDEAKAQNAKSQVLIGSLRAQIAGMRSQILALQTQIAARDAEQLGAKVSVSHMQEVLNEGDQRFMVGSEKLVDKDGFAATQLDFKSTQVM